VIYQKDTLIDQIDPFKPLGHFYSEQRAELSRPFIIAITMPSFLIFIILLARVS